MKSLEGLEKSLEKINKDLPEFPKSLKDFIVNIMPYITLILLVLAIPGIIAAFGLSFIALPFASLAGPASAFFWVGWAVTLIAIIFEAMALPGLFAKSINGWRLMFYASLITAVGNLLTGSWFGLIVGTAISLYILFQVKSYYK